MKTATTIIHTLISVAGLIQIGLGVLFWTDNALQLIPVHMLVGSVLVLSIWVLAVLAARIGVSWGFVALAVVWGLIVPILGVTQPLLLPGPMHWVIEVVHLLVGLVAIGLGEGLAKRIKARLEPGNALVIGASYAKPG